MVTEWGASKASGNGRLDEVETRKWLEFMDQNQLSWAVWSVADKNETSAALRPGASARGGWTEEDDQPGGEAGEEEIGLARRVRSG